MKNAKCPSCGSVLQVKDDLVGKRVKCRCTAVFRVDESTIQDSPVTSKVTFQCQSCAKMLKTDAKHVGRRVKCGCGATVLVADEAAEPPSLDIDPEPLVPPISAPPIRNNAAIDQHSPSDTGKVHTCPAVPRTLVILITGVLALMFLLAGPSLFLAADAGGKVNGKDITYPAWMMMAFGCGLLTFAIHNALHKVVVLPNAIQVKGLFGTKSVKISDVVYVERRIGFARTWIFKGRGGKGLLAVQSIFGGLDEFDEWVVRRFKFDE